MAKTVADIFPQGFAAPQEGAPVRVLKEMAERFAQSVDGKLRLDVVSSFMESSRSTSGCTGPHPPSRGDGGRFVHVVVLVADQLAYSSELFRVTHGVRLYPARVIPRGSLGYISRNEPHLIDILSKVFSLPAIKDLISSLLSQM